MIIDLLPRLRSMRIVLASASPRRSELLKQIGLTFTVRTSNFEENLSHTLGVTQYVEQTCRAKAIDVMQRITSESKDPSNPDFDIIISADTVVVHNQRILEKPANREHAIEILQSLSDSTHEVISGVTIISKLNKASELIVETFHERTSVTFFELPLSVVTSYVDSGEPFDKAGGYGIQAQACQFVRSVTGDYSNIVGLPVASLSQRLRAILLSHPTDTNSEQSKSSDK